MTNKITITANGGSCFEGSGGVAIYQAMVIKQACKACKIGLRVNRAYTPTKVLAMASKITGITLKRGEWDKAVQALDCWLEEARNHVEVVQA